MQQQRKQAKGNDSGELRESTEYAQRNEPEEENGGRTQADRGEGCASW